MEKFLKVLFCFIIVDFFYFSTLLSFTGRFNTKELMAVVGLFLFIANMYRKGQFALPNELLGLLAYSTLLSMAAFFSALLHNTPERTYTTFFISMLVWMSSAYVAIKCIKGAHGYLSIELVGKYIVAISVVQGLIAVIADNYVPLDNFIMTYIPGLGWTKSEGRLYGFGTTAALDSGGIRFAIASVLCAHNIRILVQDNRPKGIPLYVLSFLIITVTGNMVARTTLVGSIIGLVYLFIFVSPFHNRMNTATFMTWVWIFLETMAIVLIITSLYNSDPNFYRRTRFAFEGFFSLAEKGHWQTGSNDVLKNMYVFPDNPETWLIGDGYFIVPGSDPNYMGASTEGYYMGTDVGYLRFIFFFGLVGLAIYSLFIIFAGKTCIRMHPGNKLLFILLTAINFIVWLKVATDCFFILALFICLGYVKNQMEAETEALPETEEIEA